MAMSELRIFAKRAEINTPMVATPSPSPPKFIDGENQERNETRRVGVITTLNIFVKFHHAVHK